MQLAYPICSLSCDYPSTAQQGNTLIYSCSTSLANISGCCVLITDGTGINEIYPLNCPQNSVLNDNTLSVKGDKLLVAKPIDWAVREGEYTYKTICWNDVSSEEYSNTITVTYHTSQPSFIIAWLKTITDNMPFVIIIGLFVSLVFIYIRAIA